MGKWIDLTGVRSGMLVVLYKNSPEFNTYNHSTWTAQCDCGKQNKTITVSSWRANRYTSCGCKGSAPDPQPGQQFWEWTVLQETRVLNKRLWECQCSCGNHSLLNKTDLTRGKSKRCVRCGHDKAKLYGDEAAFNMVKGRYIKGTKNKSYGFELNDDEARTIFSSNCHYCGREPSNVLNTASGSQYIYNGIDRKDNTIGYTITNSLPCCTICNFAKRNMDYDVFIEWLDIVARYRKC